MTTQTVSGTYYCMTLKDVVEYGIEVAVEQQPRPAALSLCVPCVITKAPRPLHYPASHRCNCMQLNSSPTITSLPQTQPSPVVSALEKDLATPLSINIEFIRFTF